MKNYSLDKSVTLDYFDVWFKENIIHDIINDIYVEAYSLDDYKFKYDNKYSI